MDEPLGVQILLEPYLELSAKFKKLRELYDEQVKNQVSAEEHQRLRDKYAQLRKLYTDLRERHAKCDAVVRSANNKYLKAKESARQWKDYLEKHGLIATEHPPVSVPQAPKLQSPSKAGLKRVTSSQTTDGDPDNVPSINATAANDDNDEPEFVSARLVKRRRRNAPAHVSEPKRIKTEPDSPSKPIMLPEPSSPALPQRKAARKETSDLDAHLEPFYTPRKMKSGRACSEEASRQPVLQTTVSSLSEGDIPGVYDVKSERNGDHRDGDNDQSRYRRALQPLSVNITDSPHRRSPNSAQGKRKYDTRHKYQILSEDGDQETSQVATNSGYVETKVNTDHRLNDLLSEGHAEPLPMLKRRVEEPKSLPRSKPAAAAPTYRPFGGKSTLPNLTRPHGLEPSPPPADPADEPIRLRPLPTLNLSDFKINPKYLGSTFAFADPIRGRDARRCLPGCTRPECCGDHFRQIVAIAGGVPSKTDAQVLEEYFGPDYADVMAAYAPDRRKELLIQARASAFANQFGKHRHAFERRSTPPGFWRTDMPTTQEEEEDRAQALKLEREQVEERWRDAMRGGGRWIFRDE